MYNVLTKSLESKESVESVFAENLLAPFAQISKDYIDAISKKILLTPEFRQYPEIIALGYWFRKNRVCELESGFELRHREELYLSQGNVLHFAPSNVDTIFMYSWLLSLLMGNNNIIRLSSRVSEQSKVLISIISELLNQERFHILSKKNRLIRYEHNDIVTQSLSTCCDVRVIWGGDNSVRSIRSIPLAAHAKEVVFSDKFSFSALDAKEVASLSEYELNELGEKFYNDNFMFDQLACSSARVVIWVGDSEQIDKVKPRFWSAIKNICQAKSQYKPELVMQRVGQAFHFSALGHLKSNQDELLTTPYFSRLCIEEPNAYIRDNHQGGYLFLECEMPDLIKVFDVLGKKDQTLSVFGFEQQDIVSIMKNMTHRALDRVIPVGQALEFNAVWDGMSLLHEFTRQVSVAA